MVTQYELRSGIEFANQHFYRAFATFKEADACEVFYARHLSGSENPSTQRWRKRFPDSLNHRFNFSSYVAWSR